MRDQSIGQSFQRNDAIGIATLDGGARHAEDNRRSFILGDGEGAASFQDSQALGAIFSHASHKQADGVGSELLGDGAEQNIGRGAMSVHLGIVGKHGDIAQWHAPNPHMAVTGAD